MSKSVDCPEVKFYKGYLCTGQSFILYSYSRPCEFTRIKTTNISLLGEIMTRFTLPALLLASLAMLSACSEEAAQEAVMDSEMPESGLDVAALQARVDGLRQRAQLVRDINEIKRLQRAYGYYVDEALWDEVTALFTDDATVEFARDGLYRGKERIREYLYRLGGNMNGLSEGQLNEHFQLMPVVTLAEDGMSAKGRWRAVILNGELGEYGLWGEGPYENEYVKEDGVWKISKVRWYQTIMVPYEGAWGMNEDVNQGIYVSPEFPPDEPQTDDYGSWPETFLPPFHFDNPVGRYQPDNGNAGEDE